MDYQKIIDKYYPEENRLRHILVTHSRQVAQKALKIVDAHPELHFDRQFVEEAAMLHDIGIFMCDAPGIECHGTHPYIQHGILGAELLRADGFPKHARVCERHTGSGITREAIEQQNIPLPPADYLPETLEEQLVCYADKFFSKTHLDRERSVEEAARSLMRFGNDGVVRFRRWAELFNEE